MRTYNADMRARISAEAAGKAVLSLKWEPSHDGGYWVMTFTDGSEMCFRFLEEL